MISSKDATSRERLSFPPGCLECPARYRGRCYWQLDAGLRVEIERALVAREDTFAEASARDLFRELAARLNNSNRSILRMLVERCTVREAAWKMNISVSSAQARVGTIRNTARRSRI